MSDVSKRDAIKAEIVKIVKWTKISGKTAHLEALKQARTKVEKSWEELVVVHNGILEVSGTSERDFQNIEFTQCRTYYEDVLKQLDNLVATAELQKASTSKQSDASTHEQTTNDSQSTFESALALNINGLTRVAIWAQSERATEATSFVLEARMKLLDGYWNALLESAPRATDVNIEQLEDNFIDAKGRLDQLLSLTNTTRTATGTHNEKVRALKLPPMEIPKFSGHYRDWTSYHDMFNKLVAQDARLSGAEKLHYLKSSLEGAAANSISAYRITDANFEVAWTSLVNRYQKRREIVNDHLENIFSAPALTSESPAGLRKLIDCFSDNLRQLETLNLPTDQWDTVMVYWLIKKLDPETRRSWELTLLDDNKLVKFPELICFIERRCRSLNSFGTQPLASKHKATTSSNVRSHVATSSPPCIMCHGEFHHINQCQKFLDLFPGQRYKLATHHNLCFNCLRGNHSTKKCNSRSCMKCNRRHHTLLHYDTESQPFSSFTPTAPATRNEKNTLLENQHNVKKSSTPKPFGTSTNLGTSSESNETLLSTALVNVQDFAGKTHLVRILLDTGSQSSFITERCVQRLKLPRTSASLAITGVGASTGTNTHGLATINIQSRIDPSFIINMDALILDEITKHLPTHNIDVSGYDDLLNLPLADPKFDIPDRIDILLGANTYWQIVAEGFIRGNDVLPTAQNTSLGWILFGPTISKNSTCHLSAIVTLSAHLDLEKSLRRFWEIEQLAGKSSTLSPSEKQCEQLFLETHTRNASGRYTVHLPFNKSSTLLGNSRNNALNSMIFLERRFGKNPELMNKYIEFMDEYISLGHMELSQKTLPDDESYFIPHHPVFKQGKIRVVFDASRKTTTGTSLNDNLLVGPKLQDDLLDILVRFRTHRIAFTCDIAKMYRQTEVVPHHRHFQKILWRKSKQTPIREYDLKTVTYGTASASYLAIRSLQQLAYDEQTKYPLASAATLEDFYVDDIMTGCSSIAECLVLQQQLMDLMRSGGMELRKWASNCSAIMLSVPAEFRETIHQFDTDEAVKTLGLFWYPQSDTFGYVVNQLENNTSWTKRKILSEVSKLFDPLGLLAPIIILAKILMQNIWAEGTGWDEEVSTPIKNQWAIYRNELAQITNIKIQRWLGIENYKTTQIHGFCDASEQAYAAVIYTRTKRSDGKIYINILAAKTKVAPIKKISLPKLELCGAVLLARLMEQTTTKMHLENHTQIAWTDSTVVLSWLRKPSHVWQTFVANRVSETQSLTPPEIWRHVPGTSNPADIASRGLLPGKLIQADLWWNGPDWLAKREDQWPKMKMELNTDIERKKTSPVVLTTTINDDILERFSDIRKLKRVTAIIFRFYNNLRNKQQRQLGPITTKELTNALHFWIKAVQRREFAAEIKCCASKQQIEGRSKLRTLLPFLDDVGLLRVGGRLNKAPISYGQKHPIILPRSGTLTRLLVTNEHIINWHSGTQLTLFSLRQHYWIIGARSAVKKHIHSCIRCFRQQKAPAKQLMASLPSARVQPTRPFLVSGVDYAGPFSIKLSRGRSPKTTKAYIALFVCFSTKALHLELVSDLTSNAFLAAFRRFVSRRGICADLHSDCGTNFVGANKELRKLTAHVQQQVTKELTHILADNGTNWHFNPPGAPSFGGIWEAGVKSVKYHLRRTIGEQHLNFEDLTTLIAQIEACLNSRPLIPISDDPLDVEALTPAHFLIGGPFNGVPDPDVSHLPMNRLSRWQEVQRMLQHFWQRWHTEYLQSLQLRTKWTTKHPNIVVGRLALVIDETLPPGKWILGRIIATFPGRDGLTRVVELRCKNGSIRRPIHKIRPLPLEHDTNTNTK